MKDIDVGKQAEKYTLDWMDDKITFEHTVILFFGLVLDVLVEILEEVRKIYLKLI